MATQTPKEGGSNMGLVAVLALAVVAILIWAGLGARGVSWDKHMLGFHGVQAYFKANGIALKRFRQSYRLDLQQDNPPALRILPPHRGNGRNRETLDLHLYALMYKLENVPSLVILDKWTDEVLRQGTQKASLLKNLRDLRLADWLSKTYAVDLQRDKTAQQLVPLDSHPGITVKLDFPQFLPMSQAQAGIQPLIWSGDRVFVAEFQLEDSQPFWLLTDPDFMNNHGLMQGQDHAGQNAEFALAVFQAIAQGGALHWDESRWDSRGNPPPDPRRWSDLGRFFSFPLILAWAALLVLAALLIWRGWGVFGPRLDPQQTAYASRRASIAATVAMLQAGDNRAAAARAYAIQAVDQALARLGLETARHPLARAALLDAYAERRNQPARIHALLAPLMDIPPSLAEETNRKKRRAMVAASPELLHTQLQALVLALHELEQEASGPEQHQKTPFIKGDQERKEA